MERGRFYQQFGEKSGSGESFSIDNSVDLAGNIRALLQKETKGKVDPVWWLRFKIKNMVKESIGTKAPEEKSRFFIDAFNAYSVLAYNHFPEEERSSVAMDLRIWANGEDVLLKDPKSVQLVEAMAEATDIPYTPGQTRFNLPKDVKLY